MAVLHPKVWSEERKLLPAKQYAYPQPQLNPFKLSLESFQEIIAQSTKDVLVKALAIDCSLGGLYAQEVLARCDVDEQAIPSQLSEKDVKQVYKALIAVLHLPTKAVCSTAKAYPFPPLTKEEEFQEKESFNEALATVALSKLEKQQVKEDTKEQKEQLSKVGKILQAQEYQLKGLQESREKQKEKGELIYKHYMEVKEIFAQLDELKKKHSWDEIKEILKDNPLVSKIDEHEGKIYLELS